MAERGRWWSRFLLVAAAGGFVTGCVDSPVEVSPTRSVQARRAMSAAHTPNPNSQKYRAQTTAHATGRSGSAVLTARALMAMDGSTFVEITTGQLDQPGALGNISKVQLKFFHPASTDMHEPTQNYNGLNGGGTWSNTFTEKVRHQKLQVQANIRGVDPKRTDVVTLTERVNLRPDVAVMAVQAAATSVPNVSVPIHAVIAELNDDVGATTNCVMYVDGVARDSARGIWVADGDQVTCAFAHTFTASGTHTITVKAEGVTPGDWNLANNAASTQIEIANFVLHGQASAWQREYRAQWHNYGYSNNGWCNYWSTGYGCSQNAGNWSNNGSTDDYYQSSYIFGTAAAQWAYPLTVRTRHGTDGWDFDNRWNTLVYTGYNCGYSFSNGFNLYSCTSPGLSWIQAERWAGYAYYYSSGYWRSWGYYWYCDYYYGCGGSYTYDNSNYWQYGPSWSSWGTWYQSYGNTATWKLDVYPASSPAYTATANVPLQTYYHSESYQPWTCDYTNTWSYYSWRYYNACYYHYYRYNEKAGWTYY